jgi:hypothetical protein
LLIHIQNWPTTDESTPRASGISPCMSSAQAGFARFPRASRDRLLIHQQSSALMLISDYVRLRSMGIFKPSRLLLRQSARARKRKDCLLWGSRLNATFTPKLAFFQKKCGTRPMVKKDFSRTTSECRWARAWHRQGTSGLGLDGVTTNQKGHLAQRAAKNSGEIFDCPTKCEQLLT